MAPPASSIPPAAGSDAAPGVGAQQGAGAAGGVLLSVRDLVVEFEKRAGLLGRSGQRVRAVDGVSFDVGRGETLGLVGESGCGKTTVGRAVLRLVRAAGGGVRFEGHDVFVASAGVMRRLRREMQIVFQDPAGSLNPRMRVLDLVAEPLIVHGEARARDRAALKTRVVELLDRCGLESAAVERYPHEFSGGQRQRICIARALALSPKFIVCDEPTSALDVSIQAQILNLLKDLQRERGMSYLFISHDMAVVNHMCDRVAVMHRGRIVESGSRDEIIHAPKHEYTRTLLSAVPVPEPRRAGGRGVARSAG
ncbi:MAG TPA: ATP-binding cassette domain-containing protein [Phycisphaerales bacterium]|nr:ATP-binding cassette domain-containing protein [Phycisphaerales bacterium]